MVTLFLALGPEPVHIALPHGGKTSQSIILRVRRSPGIHTPPQATSFPWQIKAGPREFGPFCGEKSPGRIETQTNSVQILFHSDNSGENRGWKLSYTAIGNSCCFPWETGKKGFIHSAGGNLLFCSACSLFKGNPCPLVQPPINGKIEPSQAKYTFKDQVVISCNTGYKVLKVWGDGVEQGGTLPPKAITSLLGRANTTHTPWASSPGPRAQPPLAIFS